MEKIMQPTFEDTSILEKRHRDFELWWENNHRDIVIVEDSISRAEHLYTRFLLCWLSAQIATATDLEKAIGYKQKESAYSE